MAENPCASKAVEASEEPAAPRVYTNIELLHLFRRCSHAQRSSREPHGQNRLLRTLAKHGPMTQRELAANVQRTPATLCQQLEVMEAAGLVERTKCPDDRRNVLVSLTAAGHTAAEEVAAEHRRRGDELFGELSDADRAELGRLLELLLERWAGAAEPLERELGRMQAGEEPAEGTVR